MKHLVAGRNEKQLHEGFATYEEAQDYVARHRNHHVGAKQKARREAAVIIIIMTFFNLRTIRIM